MYALELACKSVKGEISFSNFYKVLTLLDGGSV